MFDALGTQIGAKGTATKGRVYAPHVVADLDGDGVKEIVVGGNDGTVAAYEFKDGALAVKSVWPASTCSGGMCPELLHQRGRDAHRKPVSGALSVGSSIPR